MPSSIAQVFRDADLEVAGNVVWGEPVPLDSPGVYLIALANQIERLDATLPVAPIGWERVNTLLARRPKLTPDGERPSPQALRTRVSAFWLPDETVLYIGMSTLSVRQRVRAFYRTEIGAARPHAGGWFIKLLGYDKYFVHYATSSHPETAEERMLAGFASRVSDHARRYLFDPEPRRGAPRTSGRPHQAVLRMRKTHQFFVLARGAQRVVNSSGRQAHD